MFDSSITKAIAQRVGELSLGSLKESRQLSHGLILRATERPRSRVRSGDRILDALIYHYQVMVLQAWNDSETSN